jgi:hypothetical protein
MGGHDRQAALVLFVVLADRLGRLTRNLVGD